MSTDLETITVADVQRSITRARASLESAAEEVIWQIEHEAWALLGHADWDAMREAEYGGAAFMVPTGTRPRLVARLRELGMTQRAIARTAGVDESTIRADVRDIPHPEPEPAMCSVDTSNGVNDLHGVLRSTDKLLANFYTFPDPALLDIIDKWLAKHEGKARRARKAMPS